MCFHAPFPLPAAQNVSVTSRYVQPLAGRVAVSGGIIAVEAQKIIRAAPGMGTMASAFAGQPFYEIFNFEVCQTEREHGHAPPPCTWPAALCLLGPNLRPCCLPCPVTWPAPFCLAANPAT